jgi:hypothetical protein
MSLRIYMIAQAVFVGSLALGQAPSVPFAVQGTPPKDAGQGAAALGNAVSTQIPTKPEVIVSVTRQPGPLREAVKQVQWKFGVAVAYEEPAWAAPGDLMPLIDTPDIINSPVRTRMDPNLFSPTVGSVEVRLPVDLLKQSPRELTASLLERVVSDHNARANPGRFRVVDLGNFGFSVVPVEVRDQDGTWRDAVNPLDTVISFPEFEGSTGEILDKIGKSVSAATNHELRVMLDTSLGPIPIFKQTKVHLGAQNEPARNVLARVLRGMRYPDNDSVPVQKFSWDLKYDLNKRAHTLTFVAVAQDLVIVGPDVGRSSPDSPKRGVYWDRSQ